jgi:hypothetical protein
MHANRGPSLPCLLSGVVVLSAVVEVLVKDVVVELLVACSKELVEVVEIEGTSFVVTDVFLKHSSSIKCNLLVIKF